MGRVMNFRGMPIDNNGDFDDTKFVSVNTQTAKIRNHGQNPGIIHTGIKAIDLLLPISREAKLHAWVERVLENPPHQRDNEKFTSTTQYIFYHSGYWE